MLPRRCLPLSLPLVYLALGCSSAPTDIVVPPSDAGASDVEALPDAGAPDGPQKEPLGPPIGAAPAPTKLADDAVAVIGVTGDGWVVYRSSQGVVAVRSDGSTSEPQLLSSDSAMVLIRGRVVFVFTNVDWQTDLGELTIWTAAHGAEAIGPAVYGENAALATEDGSWVAWIGNVNAAGTSADLVVAGADLTTPHTALASIGLAAKNTCGPRVGFAGQRLFAAWCTPGKSTATLQRLEPPSFAPTSITHASTGYWSADAAGDTLFYTDDTGAAWVANVAAGTPPQKLDSGVGWGTPLPDGSALLYTVTDQLRRASLASLDPVPIVTTGFVSRVGFDPSYAHALYSTVVTYESGVRRNLFLTPTTTLNMNPKLLLAEPLAEISRSAFTSDGEWVLYLLVGANDEKTLHARSVDGDEERTFENVDTAVAARDSRVVYSTNRSGPETYPITADLRVMDPAAAGDPVTLRTQTSDGRAFHLSADGSTVFYVMPPGDETPSALFAQAIP